MKYFVLDGVYNYLGKVIVLQTDIILWHNFNEYGASRNNVEHFMQDYMLQVQIAILQHQYFYMKTSVAVDQIHAFLIKRRYMYFYWTGNHAYVIVLLFTQVSPTYAETSLNMCDLFVMIR